jgi:hypothetical protein
VKSYFILFIFIIILFIALSFVVLTFFFSLAVSFARTLDVDLGEVRKMASHIGQKADE